LDPLDARLCPRAFTRSASSMVLQISLPSGWSA
jgi:hypothetical protein